MIIMFQLLVLNLMTGLIAPNSFKLNRLNNLMDSNNYQIFSKDVLRLLYFNV